MKICIIGFSGSGKSTLAKTLSEHYHIPLLYLDTIHWLPNWVERSNEEEKSMLDNFLSENNEWVIDGNYIHNYYWERMAKADKIIFLNFNRFVCLYRAYKRTKQYKHKNRESLTEGCKERLNLSFIWWILHQGRKKKFLLRYKIVQNLYPDKFVKLNNQKELDKFCKDLITKV